MQCLKNCLSPRSRSARVKTKPRNCEMSRARELKHARGWGRLSLQRSLNNFHFHLQKEWNIGCCKYFTECSDLFCLQRLECPVTFATFLCWNIVNPGNSHYQTSRWMLLAAEIPAEFSKTKSGRYPCRWGLSTRNMPILRRLRGSGDSGNANDFNSTISC